MSSSFFDTWTKKTHNRFKCQRSMDTE